MTMKLELEITAPALTDAINNLAAAMLTKGTGATPDTPGQLRIPLDDTASSTEETVLDGPTIEEPTEPKLPPAQAKKKALAAEIKALGGTPPERGSVAKFEAALAAAKEATEETGTDTEEIPGETEEIPGETEAVEPIGAIETDTEWETAEPDNGPDVEYEDADKGVDVDDVTADDADNTLAYSLDDVRTLAHAVVKSTPDNPTLGKTKLGACLKKVGAKNLTDATPEQLAAIVPLMEKNIGKSLAEVLAIAGD